MAILILGSSGQVGAALLEVCSQLQEKAIGLSRKELDLSQPEHISKIPEILERHLEQHLGGENPTAVINAAAYTQVDQAEKEEEIAHRINAEAPHVLARWCSERRIPFVHYSTDYVFSGQGESPWKEEDSVQPQNAYGRTKLAGEKLVASVGGDWLILRTSWVYDATGKNFVRTMLRLGIEKESLRVVSDQFGAPSFALHLAQGTMAALRRAREAAIKNPAAKFPSGIYHLCNSGVTNWHEFSQTIFRVARENDIPIVVQKVEAIESSEYPVPAKRPMNSRLDTSKIKQVLGVALPNWEIGLNECISTYVRGISR